MLPSAPLRDETGAYFTGGSIRGIPTGGDGWIEGGREEEGGVEGLWPHRQLGHPSPQEVFLLSLLYIFDPV